MTKSPLSCVVLFDIDGTLVTGPPGKTSAGVFAMNAALIAVAGKPSAFVGADYAGRTDLQIARMLLEDAGIMPLLQSQIDALIAFYLSHLAVRIADCPFHPLGIPRAAVQALRQQGARVGLGTGNVRRGAFLKLKSAGIDDLFDPRFGGFGDDGETRAALLEKGAHSMDASRLLPTVVIGDTRRDVEGAHAIGALCIGVLYSGNDRAALQAAGADAVVDTIDDSIADVIRDLF